VRECLGGKPRRGVKAEDYWRQFLWCARMCDRGCVVLIISFPTCARSHAARVGGDLKGGHCNPMCHVCRGALRSNV